MSTENNLESKTKKNNKLFICLYVYCAQYNTIQYVYIYFKTLQIIMKILI